MVSPIHIKAHYGAVNGIEEVLEAFGLLIKTNVVGIWEVKDAKKAVEARKAQREGGRKGRILSPSKLGVGPQAVPKVDLEVDPEVLIPILQPLPQPPLQGSDRLLNQEPNTNNLKPKEEECSPPSKVPLPSNPDGMPDIECFVWIQSCRESNGLMGEKYPELAWKNCYREGMLKLRGDDKKFRRAYEKFTENPYWKTSTPPWPIRAFIKNWEDYVS